MGPVYDPMFVLGSVKPIKSQRLKILTRISKEIGKQTLVLLDPRTRTFVCECLSEFIGQFS